MPTLSLFIAQRREDKVFPRQIHTVLVDELARVRCQALAPIGMYVCMYVYDIDR